MNRKDWTLLVISAANGKPLTPVQLQKTAFLLGKERSDAVGSEYYDFAPYDYGPFSLDVYRDAEELESQELVTIQFNQSGRWKEYTATPLGLSKAKQLRSGLDSSVTEFIDRTVTWARQLSFQALVKDIYRRYPEFRAHSIFQE